MSSLSPADVSVVIPTRNRVAFARQAIASALHQEEVDVEVIVVDDASDRPLLTPDDARLHVHRRRAPGGAGAARNDGIARARGRWIAFLDDDDLWSPRRLRAQLDTMGAADFGYCATVLVDAARRPLGTFSAPRPEGLREALRIACVIPGPSSVIARTDLLRELGGFREDLSMLADWDMWLRLAPAGRAAATGDLLTAYTVHDENAHIRTPRAVIHELDELVRAHGLSGAAQGALGWLAEENRAAGRWGQAAGIRLRGAWRHRDLEELGRALTLLVRRPGRDPDARPPLVGPAWLERYRVGP